jgi:hypothetical protein
VPSACPFRFQSNCEVSSLKIVRFSGRKLGWQCELLIFSSDSVAGNGGVFGEYSVGGGSVLEDESHL